MKKVAVIPGDGIGRETVPEALKILHALALPIEFEEFPYGGEHYLRTGTALTDDDLDALKEFHAIFLGAVGDPRVKPGILEQGILLKLRFHFDMYINLRPAKLLDARFTPLRDRTDGDIDIVFLRENTEGLYAGAGGFLHKDTVDEVAIQEMLATHRGTRRIIKYAFEYAQKHKRKKVTLCDKSNVLTYAHDLWQRVFRNVSREYPEIQRDHEYVDALAMKLVRNPQRFDVIVTPNLFGDILTDLAAEITGGMGLAASGNINPSGVSMFEPVHGSAPDIAGKGIANPMATILAAAMMLDFLGYAEDARRVEVAVKRALKENVTTPDMGGKFTTSQVGDWLARFVGGDDVVWF